MASLPTAGPFRGVRGALRLTPPGRVGPPAPRRVAWVRHPRPLVVLAPRAAIGGGDVGNDAPRAPPVSDQLKRAEQLAAQVRGTATRIPRRRNWGFVDVLPFKHHNPLVFFPSASWVFQNAAPLRGPFEPGSSRGLSLMRIPTRLSPRASRKGGQPGKFPSPPSSRFGAVCARNLFWGGGPPPPMTHPPPPPPPPASLSLRDSHPRRI